MTAQSTGRLTERTGPTPIDRGAAENLRYIRSTIEAAHSFTTVPGKGCIAMGLMALVATGLDLVPRLAHYWLAIWVGAATVACVAAVLFMATKARAQGLSLRRTVARRFFLTLAPAFVSGAILTVVLIDAVPRETIAGVWLLLYGAGIAAAGVFTLPVVFTAGLAFMALGTATFALPAGSAPTMLALGFGGVHIVLGEVIRRNHGG
ncbi:MAG TPA: hypothetical protein VJA26_07235 [Gammaproteobacteria bacterium]|nr:hypothetical protein [Gammaproteobacteria bacterium]